MVLNPERNNTATGVEPSWQLQPAESEGALAGQGGQVKDMTSGSAPGSLAFAMRDLAEKSFQQLLALTRDVAAAVSFQKLRLRAGGGGRPLDIPKVEDVAVPLLDLLARHESFPNATAALGLAEDGNTVFHRFGAGGTAHILVTGGHDSGKTVMLRAIAASVAIGSRQSEAQLAAICPAASNEDRRRAQAAAWQPLNYLPHTLCDVAVRHTEIVELLAFVDQEIAYRERHAFSKPPLILLIDQLDTVIGRGGRQCAEPILRIAQNGPGSGVYLAVSAQSANTPSIGDQLAREFTTRLIGRADARIAHSDQTQRQATEAEQLLGEGDFLLRRGAVKQRLQGSFIDDYDLHQQLIDMYRQKAILLAKPAEQAVSPLEGGQEQGAAWKPKIEQIPVAAG